MLLSILIHSIVFLAAVYSFSNITKVKTQEEEKLCIHLCALQPRAVVEEVQQVEKEVKVEPLKKVEIPQEIAKPKTQPTPALKKVIVKDTPVKKEEKVAAVKESDASETSQTNTKETTTNTSQTQPIVSQANVAVKENRQIIIKEEDAYLQEHLARIKQLLEENLYYPRSARKRAITGEVVVKFKLRKDATVEYIKVVKSPDDILSRGAIETIENISSKFPKPKNDLILTVPISYDLNK